MPEKYICIHGHFYQPPRENPWFEEVEFEDSAQPYHDWNVRITAECYAPNSVSRIMDSQWRIIGAVNNYSKISFNFGPTLLYWMASHEPKLYEAILNADKESAKKYSGHGSAIAQVYNHMIMPLANKRDKQTQVLWGIRDFESRYGRYPEGMWLPETAVNLETLEILAENKIKFTLLAPHQALRVKKNGEKDWTDVSDAKIDPRKAYLCKLPSGKSISLFFFDKFIASSAAFGDMLSNGEYFARKIMEGFNNFDKNSDSLVNMGTDGELYGHHHVHGDMTLAYGVFYIESQKLATMTNYAEFLEKHPPEFEVEIYENTSWSCSHGVERWRNDCGDNTGRPGWKQAWRKPLREAMDWLRDELSSKFEIEAKKYLKDPWGARNSYINVVLDRSRQNVESFLAEQKIKDLSEDEKKQVMKLLELQRQAMLMFTSCGWFFDEISGIETVQVMKYAARSMQLAQQVLGLQLEDKFLKFLENATSNVPEFENGAKTYNLLVKKTVVDLERIAAQGTILQLFSNTTHDPKILQRYGCCFTLMNKELEKRDAGKFRLVISNSIIQSQITLDEENFACVAIWLGDHNVSCGVKLIKDEADEALFKNIKEEILASFNKGEINETILFMPKYFEKTTYSLKDVFKDHQIRILESIVQEAVEKATNLNEIIIRDNSAMIHFMKEIGFPVPKPFREIEEMVINAQIKRQLSNQEINTDALSSLITESTTHNIVLDLNQISLEASKKIVKELQNIIEGVPDVKKLEAIEKLISTLQELPLKIELWQAQNIAFTIAEKMYNPLKEKKDDLSQAWVLAFQKLCNSIGIRLD
jgi:alpha-amylase/alpha-mannosidase (GH57 family)